MYVLVLLYYIQTTTRSLHTKHIRANTIHVYLFKKQKQL